MARNNNNNKLKAYVRFDGSGRIVPSSLIVQAFKPKVGNYQEIDAKECCNYVAPTTTSTTTIAPITTTTTTAAPTTTTSTTVEPTTSTTTTEVPGPYTIGQAAQGGIIAYILQPEDPGYDAGVQHGLVATTADISTSAEWGCIGTEIAGADGTAIGTGNQNTIDIMAGCATAGIAARLCGDLVEGGYSDWYLPSKDELNALYLNRVAIGGFSSVNQYWSSTENDSNTAWKQNFSNSAPGFTGKVNPFYVRAIRSF